MKTLAGLMSEVETNQEVQLATRASQEQTWNTGVSLFKDTSSKMRFWFMTCNCEVKLCHYSLIYDFQLGLICKRKEELSNLCAWFVGNACAPVHHRSEWSTSKWSSQGWASCAAWNAAREGKCLSVWSPAMIHWNMVYCTLFHEPYLDHTGEVPCICQFQYNIQLIVFNEWGQIFNHIWVIQLLKWRGTHLYKHSLNDFLNDFLVTESLILKIVISKDPELMEVQRNALNWWKKSSAWRHK